MSTRYQWSNKFKDEIIVVESTDEKWEDFLLNIDKARTTFNTPKVENIPDAFPNDEPQSESPEEECPKCGSPLIITETKTGKKIQKCSTNKWDFKTKSAIGCDFVNWNVK